jgi:DNA modification methylase
MGGIRVSRRKLPVIKAVDEVVGERYAIYQGDACELIRAIPDNSIQFGIHSPPFEGLYKFSGSDRDLSNSERGDFWTHYHFLIAEMLRITMPGRIHAVHVMQLPTSKRRDGFIGMRDFRGEVVRAYQAAGWQMHSEVCIWKDAVVAQARSKSHRLNHKQIVKDRSISGQALADYVVAFRKPGENDEPISGALRRYVGEGTGPDFAKYTTDDDNRNWYSIEVWQRYAQPVWMDIRQTRTLQYLTAKENGDEQHISPLQLDVIERCIDLWSNPDDIVFTPFLGIGSEVWGALAAGRRGIGFELKGKYFEIARANCARAAQHGDAPMADMTEAAE